PSILFIIPTIAPSRMWPMSVRTRLVQSAFSNFGVGTRKYCLVLGIIPICFEPSPQHQSVSLEQNHRADRAGFSGCLSARGQWQEPEPVNHAGGNYGKY